MNDIIKVEGLVKKYDGKYAIDGLDLSVREGEIFAFLGPNGAGKTTTVRALSTLTNYDDGKITIGGIDLAKDPIGCKKLMGVIQQHICLDKDLTVYENMMQHVLFHKIPRNDRVKHLDELIEYLDLKPYLNYKVDALSGGWKKRAAIVCALVHRPKILFLDEPTVGLDINARRLLWDMIKKLNKDGMTIFLTTHYIEEVEALCDRVGIINRGKLIALGTPAELCERVGQTAVEYFDVNGVTVYRYFEDRDSAKIFADGLGDNDTVIMRRTNLEDCFVELTGKKVGDA